MCGPENSESGPGSKLLQASLVPKLILGSVAFGTIATSVLADVRGHFTRWGNDQSGSVGCEGRSPAFVGCEQQMYWGDGPWGMVVAGHV